MVGGDLRAASQSHRKNPATLSQMILINQTRNVSAGIAPDIRECLYFYVITDEESLTGAAELFKALSATSRLLILSALADEPSSVSALVEATTLSQPLVSQQLRLLRGINLVTATRSGREIIYSLTDDHVANVIQDAIAHSQER
jgi:DNA-binding transcriptional ArsR family regulator